MTYSIVQSSDVGIAAFHFSLQLLDTVGDVDVVMQGNVQLADESTIGGTSRAGCPGVR